MTKISTFLNGLTEDTTPDTASDYLMAYDTSASALKKVLLNKLAGAAGLGADGWAAADAMTYASADSPTFTATVAGDQTTKYYPGMRVKLTQTTVKYFIITAVAYSSSTTLTLYGGTDYTLANAAITSPYYSSAKAPAGFPLSPTKWTVEVTKTADAYLQPAANVWVNISTFSIVVPVGLWELGYQATGYSSSGDFYMTLSTANNSESDKRMTSIGVQGAHTFNRWDIVSLDTKATYYLNEAKAGSAGEVDLFGARSTCRIYAACAYL